MQYFKVLLGTLEMKITRKHGQWYDETGRRLTEDEKNLVKGKIIENLDEELENTGLEGFIKKIITRYLDRKNGIISVDAEVTIEDDEAELEQAIADLEADIAELNQELAELKKHLADLREHNAAK